MGKFLFYPDISPKKLKSAKVAKYRPPKLINLRYFTSHCQSPKILILKLNAGKKITQVFIFKCSLTYKNKLFEKALCLS